MYDGNSDRHTPVTYYFDEPILLRAIRVHVLESHVAAGLRLDVIGCEYNANGMLLLFNIQGYNRYLVYLVIL